MRSLLKSLLIFFLNWILLLIPYYANLFDFIDTFPATYISGEVLFYIGLLVIIAFIGFAAYYISKKINLSLKYFVITEVIFVFSLGAVILYFLVSLAKYIRGGMF